MPSGVCQSSLPRSPPGADFAAARFHWSSDALGNEVSQEVLVQHFGVLGLEVNSNAPSGRHQLKECTVTG